MRVSSIFSIAAAAALSFVPAVFAAPLDVAGGAIAGAGVHAPRAVDAVAAADAAAAVHARGDDPCSSILTQLKVDLQVHVDVLAGLTVETATKDKLTETLKAVVSVIVDATVQIQALAGTGCTVDVTVCANLVADILIALCGALGFVLSLLADVQVLLGVIVDVALGDCLCGLIKAVLAVVDGLLAVLVPLVLSLAAVLVSLGLNVVGQLLTIC